VDNLFLEFVQWGVDVNRAMKLLRSMKVSLELLLAVSVRIVVYWPVMPCGFAEICCRLFQDRINTPIDRDITLFGMTQRSIVLKIIRVRDVFCTFTFQT
jgi:hypothetical protein